MYRIQHDIPDTPMKLQVPSDPADSWILKLPDADGIAWRTIPGQCEVELSPAMVSALMWALIELVPPSPLTMSPATYLTSGRPMGTLATEMAGVIATMVDALSPPVASMDREPPAVTVFDEPVTVGGGGA